MSGFGITQETKSENRVPFLAGINKGMLVSVEKKLKGKENAYTVLAFTFKDVENIRTFEHVEWTLNIDDEKFDVKMNGMNSRIKHLYEIYKPFPSEGIGTKAKNFDEFFDAVVTAFNTHDDGGKIFTYKKENKELFKVIWLKTVYNKKGEINFPLSPNFVELIKENNQNQSKVLVIDKRYDKIEQPNVERQGGAMMPNGLPTSNDGFEF